MTSTSPYTKFSDKGFVDGRIIAARAKLTPYQFDKLKFLVSSILKKAQVEDADTVGGIYELLLGYYASDEGRAAETLCAMLERVTHKFYRSSSSSTDCDIQDDKQYKWRLKIIEYADEVKKRKKILRHFHEKFELEMSSDDAFSSPIKLFEHMIETDRLKVGETADLVRVEKATTSFRELNRLS